MDEEDSMDVDANRMGTDSDEENSSDDEKREEELNIKKKELKLRIENDKTDYQAYDELIGVYKLLGDLQELRCVREKFSKEYPLSPELWLSWINDEKKISTTSEEKKRILDLFERALKDYQSIDVWLEYVQFSIGLVDNALESVRGTLERAVEKCGFDVQKGSLLWDLYRIFENSILESLKNSNEDNEEVVRVQKIKIANLFNRQLSVPLLNMEDTYRELQSWLSSENANNLVDIETLEKNYKKALDKLSRLLTFEDSLRGCSQAEAKLPIYQKYLKYEKNPSEGGNDQFRVICLYERALTEHPLETVLWSEYLDYVCDLNLVPEDKEAVCYRALRNCPTEANFWDQYIDFMECRSAPKAEIKNFLERAFENAFANPTDYRNLYLSYMYYLRRELDSLSKSDTGWQGAVDEIRNELANAKEYLRSLSKHLKSEVDPECRIDLWHARFEAEVVGDLEQFRLVWSDIMKPPDKKYHGKMDHGKTSSYWIRNITMEWQYGDSKHMRRLCTRALSRIIDNPKAICTLWLEYESMNGSRDSFSNCKKLCNKKLKEFAETKPSEKYDGKKKAYEKQDDKKQKPQASNAAKTKAKENNNKNTEAVNGQLKSKLEGLWNKPTPEKPKKVTPTPAVTGLHIEHDSSKDDRTIFISNLDYTVTEEEVKTVLGNVGEIAAFRLVRDFKGRSKGYGYLVFASKKSVKEALKMDRTPINQRPMFVSECDPDKQSRKTGLRFNTGLEKNKLFVKGLPVTLDKEGIEKIFSPYGKLKDVRVVTFRNGHSKGLAYVEFEDEVAAAHALLKTDQLEIEGHVISVAISNPPERKNATSLLSDKGEPIAGIALGGGSTADKNNFGLRGRGRTQLSFVPASVLNAKKPLSSESSAMDICEAQTSSTAKAMSNSDFRSMLINKK